MAKQYFELLNINHTETSVPKALGISEDRIKNLRKEYLYMDEEMNLDKFTSSMAYMLQYCESIEEVIYIAFELGANRCSAKCPITKGGIPLPPSFLPPELREALEKKLRDLFGDGQDGE